MNDIDTKLESSIGAYDDAILIGINLGEVEVFSSMGYKESLLAMGEAEELIDNDDRERFDQ